MLGDFPVFTACFEFIYLCLLFAYDNTIMGAFLGERNT